MSLSNGDNKLDTRGGCETEPQQAAIVNRPGQNALQYRIGTHSSFLRFMLSRLHKLEVPDNSENADGCPLSKLATRSSDDPAVAMLDAWAAVLDVLTFYQERIANEGFLRTAVERRSVLELARTIGYELSPGVAAATHLAFTIDDSKGAPGVVAIPIGTQVQSIPSKDGELPQVFETVEDFTAYAQWNEVIPRRSKPWPIIAGTDKLYLKGVDTNLQSGDPILIVGDERDHPDQADDWDRWDFRILRTVTPYPEDGYTEITFDHGLGIFKVPKCPILWYRGTGWCEMPIRSAYRFSSVWCSSDGRVFAVGEGGEILHYDGTGWNEMASGTRVDLNGVWGSSASDVFAVGDGGTILHYNGTCWCQMTSGTAVKLNGISGRCGTDVYAVGDNGTIFHYDGGSWTDVEPGYQITRNRNAVWCSSDGYVYIVADGGDITWYDGQGWGGISIITQPNLNGVYGRSGTDVYFVGDGGTILHRDGWTFEFTGCETTLNLNAVWVSSDGHVFIVGNGGTIIHYDGTNWTGMTIVKQPDLNGVSGSSVSDVFAVGEQDIENGDTILREPATDNCRVFAFRQRASLFGHNAPDWRAMPLAFKVDYLGKPEGTQHGDLPDQWPDFNIRPEGDTNPIFHLDQKYPKIAEKSWLTLSRPNLQNLYKALNIEVVSRVDYTLSAKVTQITADHDEHLDCFGLRETEVFAQSEELALAEQPLPPSVFGKKIVFNGVLEGFAKGQPLILSGKLVKSVRVGELTHTMRIECGNPATVRIEPVEPASPANGYDQWTSQFAETPYVITDVGDSFYLALKSSEGAELVQLVAGDVLDIAGPPVLNTTGTIKWCLAVNVNGEITIGYVTAQPDDIIPIPAEEDDGTVCEVTHIARVETDDECTTVYLADPLTNVYDRTTVKIYANVIHATHGETVAGEALGSGDGSQVNQRFQLKKPPLTYVSAPTATGTKSTLTARIDSVEWEEKPYLYGINGDARAYFVRIDNDANATVIFGDGKTGSRLPTGLENVVATYRSGIGPEGEVAAGSLILLKKRPLGVKEVVNPLAANGAAGPEELDAARNNAPLKVLTMDRIVSLRDFVDFAGAFAGIGKAGAISMFRGETQLVYITIASDTEKEVSGDSELHKNLVDGIDAARDPLTEVQVGSFRPRYFNVDASVAVDSAYVTEDVLAEVRQALQAGFSFGKRRFGQPVTAAEVVEVIHSVAAVVAVDLNALYLITEEEESQNTTGTTEASFATVLSAAPPSLTEGGAELLIINEKGITLTEMSL